MKNDEITSPSLEAFTEYNQSPRLRRPQYTKHSPQNRHLNSLLQSIHPWIKWHSSAVYFFLFPNWCCCKNSKSCSYKTSTSLNGPNLMVAFLNLVLEDTNPPPEPPPSSQLSMCVGAQPAFLVITRIPFG